MATIDSKISQMNKNKETVKKVSAKVHDELLNTSHLVIDETVATLSRMQRITGKVIKKSEPIIEKQIEITFDAVEAIKTQASKGGKRALKLFGLTKQYNKISNTLVNKISEIPTPGEVVDSAKEAVASAKSDIEQTINKATDSIKSVTTLGEVEVKKAKKTVKAKSNSVKTTTKKAVAEVKSAVKSPKRVAVKSKSKTSAKSTKSNAIVAAKAPKAKKVEASELSKIKGIGPSLSKIMNDNGIKTIADLQSATPSALKVIAAKAGNRYKSFDTTKWIAAAKAIAK